MTLPEFQTTVTLEPADDWNFADTELLEATVAALGDRRPELISEPVAMSFQTNIPRQVGLSGSSAIIMAALRALAQRAGTSWDLVELARITLEVETQVLGWAAGPQDRVVQAFTGLVDMDFATPWDASRYERLSTENLPPLFVAWDQSTGVPSNVAHSDIQQRWNDGDPAVIATMTRFRELAEQGRRSLDAGTAAADWPPLLDEAFELRRQIWHITETDNSLVNTGQRAGAGVAFAGSGGAVVGAVSTPAQLDDVAQAYQRLGAGFLALNAGALNPGQST